MKSVESQEKEEEKEGIVNDKSEEDDVAQKYINLSDLKSMEGEAVEDPNKDAKEDDKKPWRQNMKKSCSKECKLFEFNL